MQDQQQVQIQADPELMKGRYANNLRTAFTPEEFILDFSLMSPGTGETLVSRIAVSPGHLKRISEHLQSVLKKYEETFSTNIEVADRPNPIGFTTE